MDRATLLFWCSLVVGRSEKQLNPLPFAGVIAHYQNL